MIKVPEKREVYLIRHGWDLEQRDKDDDDRALRPKGIEQAVSVGEYFREKKLGASTLILCADLRRTVQTAQVIAAILDPENEGMRIYKDPSITKLAKMGDEAMKRTIQQITKKHGDYRYAFETALLCISHKRFPVEQPLLVFTQAPVIWGLTGINPKELPYAAVCKYPSKTQVLVFSPIQ